MIYELMTNYDARQSFYGKAQVTIEKDVKTLYSYSTRVAEIIDTGDGEFDVKVFGTYSNTTLRHIREFLKQEGFEAELKKQIIKDYMESS